VTDDEVDQGTEGEPQVFVTHEIDAFDLLNDTRIRRCVLFVRSLREIFLNLLGRPLLLLARSLLFEGSIRIVVACYVGFAFVS
jgi:hypothetical protein